MTEEENLELQYDLMDINMRMDFIQAMLCEEITENQRKLYYQEFHRLEKKYNYLQDQLTNEYVRRIR